MFYYRSIIYVGIYYLTSTLLTHHPTNKTTMVSCLPLWRRGLRKSAHPTPGGLFGRGRPSRGERILVALIIGQKKINL